MNILQKKLTTNYLHLTRDHNSDSCNGNVSHVSCAGDGNQYDVITYVITVATVLTTFS